MRLSELRQIIREELQAHQQVETPKWAKDLLTFLTNATSVRGRMYTRMQYSNGAVYWETDYSDMRRGIVKPISGQYPDSAKLFEFHWWTPVEGKLKEFSENNINIARAKKVIKFYNRNY